MKDYRILRKFSYWRQKGDNNYYVFVFASVIVGIFTGFGAVILKNSVHYMHELLIPHRNSVVFVFFIFPFFGLFLTYLYIKIFKLDIKPGIYNLLYSTSSNNGYMKPHNVFSSIIGSVLTVGFGASGGLESPNMSTGGGIASIVSKFFKLPYRQRIILIGVATAGTISAIFKAPVTGIIFALEVIMIDLTTLSIIPIVLASVSASLTSYLFLGSNIIYNLRVDTIFMMNEVPYYIILGVATGFFALFFSTMYLNLKRFFNKIKRRIYRFLIAGVVVGTFVYLFPAIFAEGYAALNSAIIGDYSYLFENSLFENFDKSMGMIILFFLLIAVAKAFATSVTVSAGGIGGFFTPILFSGANIGLFMSHIFQKSKINISHETSALVAMAGLISAMMHAPLSSVFFISELTGKFSLLIPLLISSSTSYITVKIFHKHNFLVTELAQRKILLTHHADRNILTILNLETLIEKNFQTLTPDKNLGDLVEIVKVATRDLFPIVDCENNFLGVISLNRIRKIMFKEELYQKTSVTELMIFPSTFVELDEHLETVAEKFEKTERFNLLVLDKGKYVGFLSRSHFFSQYRKLLREFSSD
ncbi:MAG: chloride channel protein [Bacteroidales bacterium]|nr:chloride channel protein [Bacteroidales bacterium]